MCHTFLASLQQIFQNPLDDFHTQWYFSCKSHCSCGLVWTFPQDVVVFILNTASPWIIPEKFTALQHTRFILPLFHPTKSIAMLHGRYFSFTGNAPWKFHEPTGRDTDFLSTPLQNRGRNFVRSKRRSTYTLSGTRYLFLLLNHSATITQKWFWAQR